MAPSTQGELRPIESAYPKLLDALDSQVRLILELESLGQGQRAAIEGDDASSMLGLLDERQKLIDSLTALDREAAALRGQVESQGSRISATQREEITRRAGSVAQAIRRVLAADAEDGAALERRRTAIAAELADVSDSRRAVAAYAPSTAASRAIGEDQSPMFQDRRG